MAQIIDHAENLIQVLFAVHVIALFFVNLTPTPKDNEAVYKYYKLVELLAGIVTRLAKR